MRFNFRLAALLGCALAFNGKLLLSQTQRVPDTAANSTQHTPEPKMEFEVVSIHPSNSAHSVSPNFDMSPGPHWAHNGNLYIAEFPVDVYIRFAYDFWQSADQLEAFTKHQPGWVRNQKFHIEMRASGNPTKDQVRLMVRSMLADRFKLALDLSRESQNVLALTLGSDQKLGPNLRPHSDGPPCDNSIAQQVDRHTTDYESLLPPDCQTYRIVPGPNHVRAISARDLNIPQIVSFISAAANSTPLVDNTNLAGSYDFALLWSTIADSPTGELQDTLSAPGLIESIKQQLGLQVRKTRMDMDVRVITHIEEPSTN